MKTQFEVLEYHFDLLNKLSNNPPDFSTMWINYLSSSGWSEEQFEIEMDKRIFSKSS